MAAIDIKDFRVSPDAKGLDLLTVPTRWSKRAYKSGEDYAVKLEHQKEKMGERQALLYAARKRGIVFIIQAMDAGGKDGLIAHVMTGINPQGCRVTSFKRPTEAELQQSYLQRHQDALPGAGMVAVWNRSHYEEVGVVRVHPELLRARNIDPSRASQEFWAGRLQEIKEWEAKADAAGATVVKMWLHLSKQEQARRLLARVEDPAKHWKFNPDDLVERKQWTQYMAAYSDAIAATSTERSPWYVIPADDKRTTRLIAARIINHHLKREDLTLPPVSEEERRAIKAAIKELKRELKEAR